MHYIALFMLVQGNLGTPEDPAPVCGNQMFPWCVPMWMSGHSSIQGDADCGEPSALFTSIATAAATDETVRSNMYALFQAEENLLHVFDAGTRRFAAEIPVGVDPFRMFGGWAGGHFDYPDCPSYGGCLGANYWYEDGQNDYRIGGGGDRSLPGNEINSLKCTCKCPECPNKQTTTTTTTVLPGNEQRAWLQDYYKSCVRPGEAVTWNTGYRLGGASTSLLGDCRDWSYDGCWQFAREACNNIAQCAMFAVGANQATRNAYGYYLYSEGARSHFHFNVDWDIYEKHCFNGRMTGDRITEEKAVGNTPPDFSPGGEIMQVCDTMAEAFGSCVRQEIPICATEEHSAESSVAETNHNLKQANLRLKQLLKDLLA